MARSGGTFGAFPRFGLSGAYWLIAEFRFRVEFPPAEAVY